MLLLFSVFPGKLHLCGVKVNNLAHITLLIPGSGQCDMFFFFFCNLQVSSFTCQFADKSYVIKVDKRQILRLYSKHICMFLLFLVFPGKLPLCGQSE